MSPVVWITRPRPAAERTAAAVRGAGWAAVEAPLLEIAFERIDPVPAGPWPDLVVLVSANAAEGFLRVWDAGELPAAPPRPAVAVVGERTRERILAAPRPVEVTAMGEDGESLGIALAAGDLKGRRVWIAAGDREGSARAFLPEFLGLAGAEVAVLGVYRNRERDLPAGERAALAGARPGAAVLHSPSAAEAFRRVTGTGDLAPWWTAPVVALGPTTGRRLAELACPHVRLAADPSDAGILRTLAVLDGPSPRSGGDS